MQRPWEDSWLNLSRISPDCIPFATNIRNFNKVDFLEESFWCKVFRIVRYTVCLCRKQGQVWRGMFFRLKYDEKAAVSRSFPPLELKLSAYSVSSVRIRCWRSAESQTVKSSFVRPGSIREYSISLGPFSSTPSSSCVNRSLIWRCNIVVMSSTPSYLGMNVVSACDWIW